MRWVARLAATLCAASLVLATPTWAAAKRRVEVTAVAWPAGPEALPEARKPLEDRRVRRMVRRSAENALKHLDFGGAGKLGVELTIKDLTWSEEGGVVYLSFALVGRLEGGGSARSKVRFGGHPSTRKKLERQVVTAVTDGVMSRLSELARARERDARAKRRAQDETDLAEREAARAKESELASESESASTESDHGDPDARDRREAEREEEPRRRARRTR
jgi:hypothetical protein